MKKFLSVLFLVSSFAQANVTCDISISAFNRLKMTDAEEAKIQLFLESREYNYNPTYSFYNKSYDVDFSSLHISQQKSNNGETLFAVKNLDQPQKVKSIEIPLFLNGEPIKILKPKSNLFGYFMDNGTPGFKLAMSLFRDLPKCNERNPIAVNDTDRKQLKDVSIPSSLGGIPFGAQGIGY